MVRQHYQLSVHAFEQILGGSGGQGRWRARVHEVAESQT